MKDFRINKDEQKDYIIDVLRTKKSEKGVETLEVKFADGRVFKNIVCNNDNLSKIIAKLEEQAQAGVDNIDVFEKKRTVSGRMIGLSPAFGFVGGGLISAAVEQMAPELQGDPTLFFVGVGAITLIGAIPSACTLIANNPKLKELRTIKYRNEHRSELDSFNNYENALAGLPEDTANMFLASVVKGEDPFSIVYIDSYSQDDLELIVENIEREKTYGFTYVKTPNNNKK